MRKTFFIAFTLATLLVAATVARAEVMISGTRVIYNEKQREGVVKVSNTGNMPVLLQAWIDNGNANARPDTIKVPFSVTPPVIRLDPKRDQTIRLFRTGSGLATDRETLFWFNLLEIPPKPTKSATGEDNKLQLAFRTRIKMFYRPAELVMPSEQAMKHLTFSKKGNQLVIKNASPYYITFRKIELRASKESPILANMSKINNKMVAPFAELSLPVTTQGSINNTTQVFYSIINDQGGETQGTQKLEQ
ncbi:putative chaperone protein [Yersinia frederiksenii]|uniref:fimbrial biogenesis chaperone n=2 Tax=Yersinia alsatica TaxID=2890317 RepID=UPI0005DF04CC|nr:molecular chaperone [Yersinia alsatica]OWF82363.1 fimbrial assembly protein [Yersinia frederiksenii]CFQ43288.1 putative chaperone protein [Yersinia frederiksenii]CNH35961.1 putative chaperone protein [Yersinia frederiksenii]CNH65094.1 putative chaperone protein [Yersinia frederiksenii]CNI42290.1 putative chaperone protein [Yersinia frederiksenii]